jgi:hypothetical protein
MLSSGFTGIVYGQVRQSDKSPQAATAGSGTSQVEVKTDRFSEVTTVKLMPQSLLDTPEQRITMRLDAKFGDKKIRDTTDQVMEILDEKAMVIFESFANAPTDFGDKELHFIVDGKLLKVGESAGGTAASRSTNPTYKILKRFVNSLDTAQLKKLAASRNVEMRLGKYEFVLSPAVLENFREFVREFIKYAPSSKLRERRP